MTAAIAIVLAGLVALRGPERENPFTDFKLEPAATSLVRVTKAADIPDQTLGVYFMDVQTGSGDGWYDSLNEINVYAFSGDNRLVAFRRGDPMFRASEPFAFYLGDRRTGTIYSWQGAAELVLSGIDFNNNKLAALDDRLLFRIQNPEGDDWFALIDLDPAPKVIVTFKAPAYWGVLSPDGGHAAVFWNRAFLADLRTGKVRPSSGGGGYRSAGAPVRARARLDAEHARWLFDHSQLSRSG
jgi:hypothetical protein